MPACGACGISWIAGGAAEAASSVTLSATAEIIRMMATIDSPFAFLIEMFATERLKTLTVWSEFEDADLPFRPVAPARTVHEHMVHQCLSEDGWFTKMLGLPTPLSPLPEREDRLSFLEHYAEVSGRRLDALRH